jgi:hypothetical protein
MVSKVVSVVSKPGAERPWATTTTRRGRGLGGAVHKLNQADPSRLKDAWFQPLNLKRRKTGMYELDAVVTHSLTAPG